MQTKNVAPKKGTPDSRGKVLRVTGPWAKGPGLLGQGARALGHGAGPLGLGPWAKGPRPLGQGAQAHGPLGPWGYRLPGPQNPPARSGPPGCEEQVRMFDAYTGVSLCLQLTVVFL